MGNSAIFDGNRYLVPFNRGIATPVCALARNDRIFLVRICKQQFTLVQINRQGVMTMEELLDILEALRPDVDFGREERLVEDGILDSFDIVSIVAELDGALGVRIGAEELVPENFNSARALWALVRRHRG